MSKWRKGTDDSVFTGLAMKSKYNGAVLVSLVTCNDEMFLESCLEHLSRQTVETYVRIFDNASQDMSCKIAQTFDVEVYESGENRGYSFGHNYNLTHRKFETVLLLNADVILESNYLEKLLEALSEVDRAGMAGGKLYRMNQQGDPILERGCRVLDSTGIYFTPSQRHLDRGGGERDSGLYNRRQSVFGITGAAVLCRKEMLDDLCFDGEYLDEDFFAYREDADLAWRAQLRGWRAIYEPEALAFHHRNVLPARRHQNSPLINYHSLKNRYLMRMKNMDWRVRKKCFPHMWIRDIGILVYVLLWEWSSLSAFCEVWRLRAKFRTKRRQIQIRRNSTSDEIARWFSFTPEAEDS